MHKFCTYKLATTMHVGIAGIDVQETQVAVITHRAGRRKHIFANIFLQTRRRSVKGARWWSEEA